MKTLIGIDIGTQGTKAALFDEDGVCLAEAFQPSKLHRPEPGTVEEDPERQFGSVCATIRHCVRESGIAATDVAGIGIDGQMAGVIGVGRDGMNVTPYDSWLDTRCAAYIATMNEAAGEEIVARTGGPASFNHGPKILWWKDRRRRDYRRIAAFVQPGGYAAMRLCGLDGAEAFIDTTYLHFSGFADNASSQWNVALCRQFEVALEKLPKIVRPESIVGELTVKAARRCGLRAGVPVVGGCGDTAASFLGCGATRAGIAVDVAGTASVFAATTDSFQPDIGERILACGQSAVPGLWHPYAYINGGGLNLAWFARDVAGGGMNEEEPDFKALDRLAETIDPRDDLPIFVPHLGGRVSPAQPELRGAWAGLTWDHRREHLYRAVLEGVALEYAIYQRRLRQLYGETCFKELRVTGGGERSELWNSIKADALQVPLRRVARGEGAPLGVAMLAGWGVGILKGLAQASRRWINLGQTTRPKRKRAAYYATRRAQYAALLKHLNDFGGGRPGPID